MSFYSAPLYLPQEILSMDISLSQESEQISQCDGEVALIRQTPVNGDASIQGPF